MKATTKPRLALVPGCNIGRRFFKRTIQVEQVRISFSPLMGSPKVEHIVGNAHWVLWSDKTKIMVVGDNVAIADFEFGAQGWYEASSLVSGTLVAEGYEKEAWSAPVKVAPAENSNFADYQFV